VNSLRARLILMVIVTVGITLAVSIFVFSLAIDARKDSLDDRSLKEQVGDIERHIAWRNNQLYIELPAKLLRDYRAGAGQFIYVVSDETGRILGNYGSSNLLRNTQIPTDEHHESLALFSTIRQLAGEDLKFFAAEKWVNIAEDQWVNIQVAQGPLHEDILVDEILKEMLESYGSVVIGLIAALVIGIIFVLNQLTKSLRLVEAGALAIRPGSGQMGIEVDNLPRELVPVVAKFNNALQKLDMAYIQQRNFSDIAAHELRSPLAIVRGQAERLPSGHEKETLLDDISHMEQILARLLELAHSESAVLGENKKLELGQTLGALLADVGAAYVRRGLTLDFQGLDEPVWVHADVAMLEVILRNLLDNAVSAGGNTVSVFISYDCRGGVRVCDNGPGVAEIYWEKIFERFMRLNPSHTNGSAGLGLAIVRRLAEAQGARVTAHRAPQGGLEIGLEFLPAS